MSTWDHFQYWSLVLPPSRPSPEQLAAISHSIEPIDRSLPVAVLGSTPEFRDLLFELGFTDIFVMEKNKQFHDSITATRVHANLESLVLGDWLDQLPEFRDRFALILSDLTSGNVPYDDRDRFYKAITHALRPGGFFIDKILTHPIPHIPVDELFAKYTDMPINLASVNTYSSEMLFCSSLLAEHNLVDSSRFYAFLDAESPTPRLRAFARQSRYITPERCIWYYGRSWNVLERTYCPTLVRSEICTEEATSPYFKRVKHFLLTLE